MMTDEKEDIGSKNKRSRKEMIELEGRFIRNTVWIPRLQAHPSDLWGKHKGVGREYPFLIMVEISKRNNHTCTDQASRNNKQIG